VGRFDVLRRNRDGELPDLDYWNQALGNDLEFGRLADKSSFPKLSPCEPNRTANCLPFVSVKLRSPVSGNQPITLALSAGRFHYRIHFKSAPGQSQYYLPVGRMWFYAALSRAGLSLQIDGIEGITDVEVSGAYRIVPSSILY
jgi:hypothetical protein